MIRFTHTYNLLLTFCLGLPSLYSFVVARSFIELLGFNTKDPFLGLFLPIAFTIWVIFQAFNKLIWPLSTLLYVCITLQTPISWAEAKQLTSYFEGYLGKWYPMKHVRDAPPEMRRQVLFATAQLIDQEKRSLNQAASAERYSRVVECASCLAKIQVPAGRGSIQVRCPTCSHAWTVQR